MSGFTHRFCHLPCRREKRPCSRCTGQGDENDLLPLAKLLASDANLLSPRGRDSEAGLIRFFRVADGYSSGADSRHTSN